VRNLIKALCVAGMSLAMAAPAFAGAQLYTSLRYDTFYANQKGNGGFENNAGDKSTTTLVNEIAGNARIGAKFTEGNLFAHWEMGLPASNLRLAYGTYKFNGGSVLIGQTYNPWSMFSDQVYAADNGFIGYGCLYDGRQPQIKLDFSGFYIALVSTKTTAPDVGGQVYTYIPKVGIGYDGKAGPATFGAGFAYNTVKDKNTTGFDENINSYLIYARASVAAGPVTVSGQGSYGQNLGNFGLLGRNSMAEVNSSGTGVKNNKGWGGFVQVSAKVSAIASVAAGVGYTHDNYAGEHINKTSVFVNAPIEIAKGFHVVPEFDYFHNSNPANGASFADAILPGTGLNNVKNAYVFGAKWQIDL
jgi:hypothetical protein